MKFIWKEAIRLPNGRHEAWQMCAVLAPPQHFGVRTYTQWFVEKTAASTPFRYWCVDASRSEAFPECFGPFTSLSDAQQFAETTYTLEG